MMKCNPRVPNGICFMIFVVEGGLLAFLLFSSLSPLILGNELNQPKVILHKVFPDPGHSLSKTTEKGHLHKVFIWDILTSGSLTSQEFPAQKLYV